MHNNQQSENCSIDFSDERATFISTCVKDLKANLISCEKLSERLFCINPQSNDKR